MHNNFIKMINVSFAILLLIFAYLQFNDPDPAIWVSFYVICVLVPLLSALNFYDRRIFWVAAALCLLHLIIGAPGAIEYFLHHIKQESIIQDMSPERPYIEETREFLGTLITLIMISITAFFARKKAPV